MSTRKRDLNREDDPPEILSVARLTVVRPGRPIRYLCCSEKLWGFYTHWNPDTRRTVECTKPEKLCVGHAKKLPVRWKGVLTVVPNLGKVAELLDIPPETGQAIKTLSRGFSLRGKILLFQRETANIRSRLLVEDVGDYDDPAKIPADIDPTPTLMKIWGITR